MRAMSVELPRSAFAALQDHAIRLYDSRRAGTPLSALARDLLLALYDVCTYAGLDRALDQLGEAFAPIDLTDRAALASSDAALQAVIAKLEAIDLDGGGPRGAKPRQLADSVTAALDLAVVDDPERAAALDDAVRSELVRALASVIDVELAPAKLRAEIIADARARCAAGHHASFDRLAAQLDERGLQVVKQPKIPIDALHAAQHALYEARNAVIARAATAAVEQARAVLAGIAPELAARLDQPVTLRATPREVAARRACDPRVTRTPAHIVNSLLASLTDLLRITWRAPAVNALPYAASKTFAVGDVIDHPKFGRGKVTACVAKRIDVEFADGPHTLIHTPAK